MPTVQIRTVGPNVGDDFADMTSAVAALPSDFVANDEQWVLRLKVFVGGLNDSVNLPNINTDATRNLIIEAFPGDEYIAETGAGAYMTQTLNNEAIIRNTAGVPHLIIRTIGLINTGTSSPRALRNDEDNCTFTDLYGQCIDDLSPNQAVIFCPVGLNTTIERVLTRGGDFGVECGNNGSGSINKLTAIDPSNAAVQAGSSTYSIDNSLHIDGAGGGSSFANGTFTGDHNATSDSVTPVGANSLANRTTGDLADYAGNDYRTDSGSALATAGSGGTFIGYALESSATIEGDITVTLDNSTSVLDGTLGNNITGDIAATLQDAISALNGTVGNNITGDITVTLDNAISVIDATLGNNITGDITVTLDDSISSLDGTVGTVIVGNITVTTDDATSSLIGTIGNNITGDITVNLDNSISALSGTVGDIITGDITVTLEEAIVAIDGTLGNNITGDITVTTDDSISALDGIIGNNIAGDIAVLIEDSISQLQGTTGAAKEGNINVLLENAIVAMQGQIGAQIPDKNDVSLSTTILLNNLNASTTASLDDINLTGEL